MPYGRRDTQREGAVYRIRGTRTRTTKCRMGGSAQRRLPGAWAGTGSNGGTTAYLWVKTQKNKINIKINLKYYEGDPVIKEIKRISKPGRRVYSRANSIPRVMNGLGLAIISTPKGVMSDTEARKNNIGGEIICRVF